MKNIICFLPLLIASYSSVCAGDFLDLTKLHAGDIELTANGGVLAPTPSVHVKEGLLEQELIYKFTSISNRIKDLKRDSILVKTDIAVSEKIASRIIQTNNYDFIFLNDLQKLSKEISIHLSEAKQISYELKELLSICQKSSQLNDIARVMELNSREMLNIAWLDIENASENLELTIRSGKPELIGYSALWTATDISVNCKDFSNQARNSYYDVRRIFDTTIEDSSKPGIPIPAPIPLPPHHPFPPGPITPAPSNPTQDTPEIEQCKDDCNDQYGWDCEACADLPNPIVRKVCYANAGTRLGTCVKNCHK